MNRLRRWLRARRAIELVWAEAVLKANRDAKASGKLSSHVDGTPSDLLI
jgi:hypothetical protein